MIREIRNLTIAFVSSAMMAGVALADVTIMTDGGSVEQALRKASIEPIEREMGIHINVETGGDKYTQLKAHCYMVRTDGNKDLIAEIKAGIKKEEYREIKPFWKKRLRNIALKTNLSTVYEGFQRYDRLVFTLGYPKADDTERRLVFKNPKIRIGQGKPEWGAECGKLYFVITWEE